jgi:nitroreductase
MSFDDIITKRRSIRRFKEKQLSREVIEAILIAGNKAPSAKNAQHWSFHVFHKQAKKDFANYCLEEFEKIANDPDVHPYAHYSFKIMKKAPVLIVVFCLHKMPHPSRPDIQSIGAAIQNMLLKAQSLDVGSLWICDILYIEEAVQKYLQTKDQLIAVVAFGYAVESPKKPNKKPYEQLTTWHD